MVPRKIHVRGARRSLSVNLRVPALVLTTLFWGYNWVQNKIASGYSTPFEFTALRSVLAAFVLFAALVLARKPLRPRVARYAFWIGVAQVGGFGLFTQSALVHGGVGKSAILAYTFPFWVALIAWPVLGERFKGLQLVAIPIALAGVALIMYPFDAVHGILSALFAIAGGLSWAVAAILTKLARRDPAYDTLNVTAWQMLFGAGVLTIGAGIAPHPPIVWSAAFILALTYNAVIANALGWFLWMYSLGRLPAGIASFAVLMVPVVSGIAAALQLHERPPAIQVLGIFVLLVALLVFSAQTLRDGRKELTPAEEVVP